LFGQLYLQHPQCQHSHSFQLLILQNEEAFEYGMNEKIAETEDAVKKGIEKPGVQIHAENAIKSGFIEEALEDNMKMEMNFF
jgi:hypothetical protein